MQCLDCNTTIKHPKGVTRETQRCGMCRGVKNQSMNKNGRFTYLEPN